MLRDSEQKSNVVLIVWPESMEHMNMERPNLEKVSNALRMQPNSGWDERPNMVYKKVLACWLGILSLGIIFNLGHPLASKTVFLTLLVTSVNSDSPHEKVQLRVVSEFLWAVLLWIQKLFVCIFVCSGR